MEFFMRQKEKRQERKKKLVQLQAQWRYHLEKYGMDILYSDNFKKTDSYIQEA